MSEIHVGYNHCSAFEEKEDKLFSLTPSQHEAEILKEISCSKTKLR